MELKAVKSPSLSKKDDRFVLVDVETGEIVDDAQGYGYKSAAGAHRSWAYTHRDKSKDKQRKQTYKKIREWINNHSEFCNLMDAELFDIAVGRNPEEKVNADLFRKVLGWCELDVDFSIRDLMKVYLN